FSTSVDVQAQPGRGTVRVRSVTLSKTVSGQHTATGTKVTPGQPAAGQFTYQNNCGSTLQIAAGQRLRSTNGAVFAQLRDVTLNPREQQTVEIKAVQTGQNGNVAAGQLTGIENNQFPCLIGANEAPTGGGSDDVKQTVIQTSDIQEAKADLE